MKACYELESEPRAGHRAELLVREAGFFVKLSSDGKRDAGKMVEDEMEESVTGQEQLVGRPRLRLR